VDELAYQIRRIAPSEGFFGAVWQTPSVSSKGVPIWESACFSSIDPFIEALRVYPSALSVKNLYCAHATFKEPDLTKRRNPPQLDRHARNLLTTRTLVIDGDVKPGAFGSTAECKRTICATLAEICLKPSFIVLTSAPLDPLRPVETSGMHLYLTMTRAPSLEDWKSMALDLVAILKHSGLVFDTGVTTDPVRIVRPCGSLNRKTDEARVARLDLESIDGPDYDPDELRGVLARARPPGCTHNSPPSDHTHVDLAEVASAADYLLEHGHYGPGFYFHLRDLFFGLAQLAHERPELHDEIRLLFERIAIATGRDHAKAMSWFDSAVARAPGYADQDRTTIASTFHYALQMGWRPPLTAAQRAAIDDGRGIVRGIFNSDLPRGQMEIRAAIVIDRASDPVVRRRYGDFVCAQLMRRGWPESVIINALSLARRAEVDRVPGWLVGLRRSA
jgi:hypothetical protein